MNYTCAEAITPPDGDPNKLCPGTAAGAAYDKLARCTCGDAMANPPVTGPCQGVCGDNSCKGDLASDMCVKCIQDTQAGCGKETTECANN